MTAQSNSFVLPGYRRSSIIIFIAGMALFVGINLGAYLLQFQGDLAFVTGFPLAVLGSLLAYFLQRKHFRTYNYAWYSKEFPANVRDRGRVSCRHCGSNHISARNLMQRTFHRAHVCNQCGATLYFSPER